MERLTMTSNDGGLAFTFDLDVTCQKSEILKIVALGKRLKTYEDTSLTPDEIESLKTYAERLKFELERVTRERDAAAELIRGNCKYCRKRATCHAKQGSHALCWKMRGSQQAGEGEAE